LNNETSDQDMKAKDKRKARVIKKAVKVGDIPVLAQSEPAQPGSARQAEVRLADEDGDRARIEVLCPCGEKITILCEYDTET
jgi:hypothetical protein